MTKSFFCGYLFLFVTLRWYTKGTNLSLLWLFSLRELTTFMVALCNRADHYIFAVWFLHLLFFLASSQPLQIGCLPYFYTLCGLSANFRCRSEMCCTRLAENTGRKNVAKNRHLGTMHRTTFSGYIFATKTLQSTYSHIAKRNAIVRMSVKIGLRR